MSCDTLNINQDGRCQTFTKKVWQQLVLVRKADVKDYLIQVPKNGNCAYRIYFNLLEGKSGVRISSTEKSSVIFGSYSKSIKEGLPQYNHKLQLPIFGISESQKCLLQSLDFSEYFGAIRYYDDTIEIYGFENGLATNNYDYNVISGGGMSVIALESVVDENFLPYIYATQSGDAVEDFNNNFADVPFSFVGDFNDDFNDDFFNQD